MSEQQTLFVLPELPKSENKDKSHGVPRLLQACRDQYEMKYTCLNDLVREDHPVRQVWDYVSNLDLSKALNNIKSVEGNVGRPAIDPKILVTLWLFATTEGIGSARLLAKLTKEHTAYQWICGGVEVDRKTISNFRVQAGELFDDLLIQGVMIMVKANVIKLEEVIQDGMRVRASAGSSSFRRSETISELHNNAREWVNHLKRELNEDPRKCLDRKHATKKAGAQKRVTRLENAQKEVGKFVEEKQANRRKHKKKALTPEEIKQLRVSTTDPEARVMKMPNGGFSPAYNFQFGMDSHSQIVLSATVTNSGRDAGQLIPMLDEIETNYHIRPERYLVDGGYSSIADATELARRDCTYYAPPQKQRKHQDISKRRASQADIDPSAREWIERMDTKEAKDIYGRRMMVELVNAHMRNRGLWQLFVRGLKKAKIVASLYAVAYNMTRSFSLDVV